MHHVGSIPDRLQLIAQQVDKSIQDPWTKEKAVAIITMDGTIPWTHGGFSEAEEIGRVFWYTKNNIGYVGDPSGIDYYPQARRTEQLGGEDCDGHTIYLSSILGSLGYTTGAKVVSADGNSWHIYNLTGLSTKHNPSEVIPLDTTQKPSVPGWEPPVYYQKHVYVATFDKGKAWWKKLK